MSWVSKSRRRSLMGPGPMLFDSRSPWKRAPGINGLISSTFACRSKLSLPSDEGCVDSYCPAFPFIQQTKSYWLKQNPSPFTPVCSISSGLGCSDARDKPVLFYGRRWTINLSRAQLTLLPQHHPSPLPGQEQLDKGMAGRAEASATGSSQLCTGTGQGTRPWACPQLCITASRNQLRQCPSLQNSCKMHAALMWAHTRNCTALQHRSLLLTELPGESISHSRHLLRISLTPLPSQLPPVTTSITLMGTLMCLASDSALLLRCHLVLMS